MKKIFLIFIMILFFFMTWSCQRVAQESEEVGKLIRVNLTDVSGIPSEFGKLISVTSVAEYPRIMQMWFEDSIGDVFGDIGIHDFDIASRLISGEFKLTAHSLSHETSNIINTSTIILTNDKILPVPFTIWRKIKLIILS